MPPPVLSPILAALVVALAAAPGRPAGAQTPVVPDTVEHLPRRARPPAPGQRPAGLPAYGERLGVPAGSESDRAFDRLVDGYLLVHFRLDPIHATKVGLHDYDALYPPTDSTGIVASIAVLDSIRARLETIDPQKLGRERRFDHALLAGRLRGRLLDLTTIRTWQRDPGLYLSIAGDGIRSLLAYDDAPLEDRAWNIIARLTDLGRVLRNGRKNLAIAHPPRPCTEAAIERAAELTRYLSNRLPTEMAPVRDPILREEFDHHLAQAAGAAADYYDWLRGDVLPRSNGALALGAETYARKLRDDEGVTTSLDSLYANAVSALRETRQRMEDEVKEVEPGLSVRDALARIARDPATGADESALASRDCPSLLRALFTCRTSVAGWARDVTESLENDRDPSARLAQFDRSLLRLCDCVAGLSLHARGGTYEDAIRLYEREAFLSHEDAERAARQVVVDPARSFAAIEAWRLSDLRTVLPRIREERAFLDDLRSAYGGAPIALVRSELHGAR